MIEKERIITEIERLMNWKPKAVPSRMRQRDVLNIRKSVLLTLKDFINSLQVEKPSEDLEEAAEEYSGKASHPLNNAFKAGANWQKERTINKACKWLVDNVKYYAYYKEGREGREVDIDAIDNLLPDFKKAMEGK